VTVATEAKCPRPRRDPKDAVLQGLYILLFAIAGITCLTGILFLRSGLRIAEPASSTGVISRSAPPVPAQGRAPSGKAGRR